MIRGRIRRIGHRGLVLAAATGALGAAAAGASPAYAGGPSVPFWKIVSRAVPTNLPLKGTGEIHVTVNNLGSSEADGEKEPITVEDTLPPGVKATGLAGQSGQGVPGEKGAEVKMKCSAPSVTPLVCTFPKHLPPFTQLTIVIPVKTEASAPSNAPNEVRVSGGGATPAELKQPVPVSGQSTKFGVEHFELTPENADGSRDVQAGSHPYQLTTIFDLNETLEFDKALGQFFPSAPAAQRNLSFELPPGLIGNANVVGNPNAVQQCSDVSFGALTQNDVNNCPENTAIGVALVEFTDPALLGYQTWAVPVFNLVPSPGEPARFGFEVSHVPIILDSAVRTGGDYGVTVSVHNTSEAVEVLGSQVTFWGVPGDPRHDSSRGWECLGNGHWLQDFIPPRPCKPLNLEEPSPFLMVPASCTTPLATNVEGNAWSGETLTAKNEPPWALETPSTLSGCEKLPFEPTLEVFPDQHSASTPTGMTVKVSLPQKSTLEAEGISEADIRSTTLELPEGIQTNAGAANGLETCSVGQIGFGGLPGDTGPTLVKELEEQHFTPASAACPDAAKIGTVSVKTPLLAKELKGAAYIGQQNTNPFAPPLVLYVVAEEEESKVLVKLAGEVQINPTTGQLISTFKNTPQTPFETLTLHLFNTERASQSTPAFCGSYHARALFKTWSNEEVTERQSAPFQITSGPNGTPCPEGALPFSPGFEAGATNAQAGAFSPFTLTIKRPDGSQELQSLTMHLPPGAAAMLSSVTPCPEPQAANDECGPESLIGHSTALSGLGGSPVALGGEVYLTGPYKGAPFGLLSVTHAKAGPFDLGNIAVRSTINVDPSTAAATITSDPIPQIVKGAPAQIKELFVTVDRPGFEFNPTNCNPMAVTATLAGYEGANTPVSWPLQVQNCGALPFNPDLKASIGNSFSKLNGINFKVTVKAAPGEANIAKSKLVIPMQLPSRLTTIQKACIDATFNANPASCPEGSLIGSAVVHTPVLKSPLTGPAYLVSHGGAAFPDVEFVLQGEGILLILDGQTNIHNGITTSTFNAVPDAPVNTFEATFPEGPHSALTGFLPNNKFSMCGQHLTIPTTLTGQNGNVIERQTPVAIEGACKAVPPIKLTKLQLALKACKKIHSKSKRQACERTARRKYGHKASTHKKKKH